MSPSSTRRQFLAAATAVAALTMIGAVTPWGGTAQAADAWPSRPIRMVVPFPPGGSNDVIARRLAQRLSTSLGQSVVIENRAGAGSVVGASYVANSPPDGYTLLFVSNSLATTAAVQKTPYDPFTDFTPVARVASSPFLVLTREGFTAKTLPDLLAYAKANPGVINYGSAGLGDSTQLAAELLSNMANVKMQGVNYKGITPAQMDLVAGRIDMIITTVASIRGTLTEKLPVLAFTSEKRNADYPQVPTVKETTGLDYVVDIWWGVFGPKGLPAPVLERLNREINAVVNEPEFAVFLKSVGAEPAPSTPALLGELMKRDVTRWTETARRSGIVAQ